MMALSSADRTRLASVLRLLGSDQPGERDAAGLAATRIVRGAGLDWADLLQPVAVVERIQAGPHRPATNAVQQKDVAYCLRYCDRVTPWERDFIGSISRRSKISDGQAVKLRQIVESLRARGFA